MKKISDYFGTKTAIKCENEQQWERLKELAEKLGVDEIQLK